MRNLKLEIEYEGTRYCGWQTQISSTPSTCRKGRQCISRSSVQETVEKTLQKILQEKVSLYASGRTDAGVHAVRQIAHARIASALAIDKLTRALNSLLPSDIAIRGIEEVSDDFHARFAARSKIYRYLIINSAIPSVFLERFALRVSYPLSVLSMKQAAGSLVGRYDFRSFCASGSSAKDTVRTVANLSIKKLKFPLLAKGGYLIVIEIEANGFLYNMVRNIVGTLIQVGAGKLRATDVKKILLAKNRKMAGPTAPAKGLCLVEVKY
jgi:tRNA pseudouridine38-40 synthase